MLKGFASIGNLFGRILPLLGQVTQTLRQGQLLLQFFTLDFCQHSGALQVTIDCGLRTAARLFTASLFSTASLLGSRLFLTSSLLGSGCLFGASLFGAPLSTGLFSTASLLGSRLFLTTSLLGSGCLFGACLLGPTLFGGSLLATGSLFGASLFSASGFLRLRGGGGIGSLLKGGADIGRCGESLISQGLKIVCSDFASGSQRFIQLPLKRIQFRQLFANGFLQRIRSLDHFFTHCVAGSIQL